MSVAPSVVGRYLRPLSFQTRASNAGKERRAARPRRVSMNFVAPVETTNRLEMLSPRFSFTALYFQSDSNGSAKRRAEATT
jgi:hypothetical protein